MKRDTPDTGAGPGTGWFGRARRRWRELDRGWQASLLGALVVAGALAL
ncbi:MAG: hypothetical protein ABEH77_08815 [Halobacteriaceae archaeon]